MADVSLTASIEGDAQSFIAALRNAQNALNGFSNSVGAKVADTKKAFSDMASEVAGVSTKIAAATGVAGAAILGGLGYASKGAADFKGEMAGVYSLLSQSDFDQWKDRLAVGAQEIRMEFGITGKEVGEAARLAVGSGVEAGNAVDFLRRSAKAATSGMVPLKDVVGVTATTVKAMGYTMADTQRVQDALAMAVNLGTIEWSNFATGLGQVIPFAKMAGMNIEEVGGTLAELTLKGIPADQTFTSFKATLQNLLEPQKAQQQAWDEIGIKLRDANGAAKPFIAILTELKDKLAQKGVINVIDREALDSAQKKVKSIEADIQNVREKLATAGGKDKLQLEKRLEALNDRLGDAKKAVAAVANDIKGKLDKSGFIASLWSDVNAKAVAVALLSDNMEGLNKTLAANRAATGAVDQQFKNFSADNPRLQNERLGQSFEVLRENIGNIINDVFGPFIGWLNEFLPKVSKWIKENQGVVSTILWIGAVIGSLATIAATVFGAIAAAAGIVAIATSAAFIAVKTFILGFFTVTVGIWVAIVAAVVAAIAAIVYNWRSIVGFFSSVGDGIVSAFREALAFVSDLFNATVDTVAGIWNAIPTILVSPYYWAAEQIAQFFTDLETSWDDAASVVSNWVDETIGYFLNWYNTVSKWVSDIWGSIKSTLSFADSTQQKASQTPLPSAANGGILSGPSSGYLAMLHGTEVVLPANNRGQLAAGLSAMGGGMSNTTNNTGSVNITINAPAGMDTRQLARAVAQEIGRR